MTKGKSAFFSLLVVTRDPGKEEMLGPPQCSVAAQ
jgi:hypothetical protein